MTSTRDADELRVLGAITNCAPPYRDEVRRRSGLAPAAFDAAVKSLVERRIIRRFSAPLGDVLYYPP